MKNEELISIPQAAEILEVHRTQAWRLIKGNNIETQWAGHRTLLVSRQAIVEFAKRPRRPGPKPKKTE